MNSVSLLIYLADVVNNIGGFLILFIIIACITFIVFVIEYTNYNYDEEESVDIKNKLKMIAIFILVFSFFKTVIPSKECIVSMVAVPYLMENTNVKELPNETVDAILRILKNTVVEKEDKK